MYNQYGVDLVISGHVHAYERTHPMRNYQVRANEVGDAGQRTSQTLHCSSMDVDVPSQLDNCGPVYLTVGDGGNIEGPYREKNPLR